MDKETLQACEQMLEKLDKLEYIAATSMSYYPSPHVAGGVVLSILNEDAALKNFCEAVRKSRGK